MLKNSKQKFALIVLAAFFAGSVTGGLAGVFGLTALRPGLVSTLMGGKMLQGQSAFQLTPASPSLGASSDDALTIQVVKQSLPAVVSINISKIVSANQPNPNDIFGQFFGQQSPPANPPPPTVSPNDQNQAQPVLIGGGSGFFVSQDGMIVTNKHVVSDPTAQYTVVTQAGIKYPAKVLALDPVLDLAIIKVEGDHFPYLELGDSEQATIGQTVIAIGYALAQFENTVTKGIISGIHRRVEAGGDSGTEVIEGAIQTDAAINPGNSGGPLIDLQGNVLGVDTAVSQDGQSLGFALPINAIKQALDSVKKNGRIIRPWIGVRYVQIDDAFAKQNGLTYSYGALIVRGNANTDLAVIPGSPADKAGLVENDIILEVNGQQVDTDHSLSSLLDSHLPGDKLTLKIVHQGKEKDVMLTLEERPSNPQK